MRITGITVINENEEIYLMNNGEQYKVIDGDDTPPLCQWSKNLESLEESDSQAAFGILKNLEINVDGSKATACYEGCCGTRRKRGCNNENV